MLTPHSDYESLYAGFRWSIPRHYNIAQDVSDRHVRDQPNAPALIYEKDSGQVQTWRFLDIARAANRTANMLIAHGLSQGERVGILLGQCPETAIVHVAAWKMAAVSLPLFTLFGDEALRYRLAHAGAKILVTNAENYPKIAAIRDHLPALKFVFLIDGAEDGTFDFWQELAKASDHFETVQTTADTPAFISFTSGTTGPPKGALHAHRVMLGHMPGFDMLMNFYGQAGDLAWSPADWAWIAGLMDVLFPSWWHGKPVLAFRGRGRFDPELAFHMMAKHQVRCTLLVPTMLKMMRQVSQPPQVMLRSLFSGGETVGAEILEWAEHQLGVVANEGYGQTECNLVLAHCPKLMTPRYGALGKAPPGHIAAIVDDHGRPVAANSEGHIAFKRPDPVMMLEYWRDPEATAAKYAGDWLLTGDRGRQDEDGYIWFVGRNDDVITSSGYRIGPGEIEDCLIKHPAVALAAAIGIPDPQRTEVIKAFVVLAEGVEGSKELEDDIRGFVRTKLAKHEYPRHIAFVQDLPVTATGKVIRRELRRQERERQQESL